MFSGWNDFFVLMGTAAATLIGLMFLVVSLTQGLRQASGRGQSVFTSPVVFHLSMTLAISAVLLAPRLSLVQAASALGACATLGASWSVYVSLTLLLPSDVAMTDWTDPVCYGVIPAVLYACLLGAAWAVWRDATFAAYAVGAALLALLLVSIRNAWDLVTFIAQRAHAHRHGNDAPGPDRPPGASAQ